MRLNIHKWASITAPLVLFCAFTILLSFSCKKKRAFKDETGQVTLDNRMTQGENDEAIKDVNTVILEQHLLRGKSPDPNSLLTSTTTICGVKLDTSGVLKGIITLNYSGVECYGRSRTGSIKITLTGYPLKKWKNPGCVIRIDYTAYKVTRTSDGRTIQLDGTQYLTNNSGGTWFDLWFLNQPSVVYTLTGEDIKATFNGSENAIFNFNRRMTFTFADDITTCRVEGLGSQDGRNDLENWGQTRQGAYFTTQVSEPVVWKTKCGAMAPVSGEVIVKVSGKDFEMKCKMGTDRSGNQVGDGSGECPYGYEMTWSYKKKTNSRTFNYY